MSEEWREVIGFAAYEVSNQGRVRSWIKKGRWNRRRTEPVILASSLARGYPSVKISNGSIASIKRRTVHRLVLEAFVGPCPSGYEACHNNGDPRDNRVSNLRWGTSISNKADTLRHGKSPRGIRNGQCKLTETEVLEIRADHRTQSAIAKDYKIQQGNVSMIKHKKSWAWL